SAGMGVIDGVAVSVDRLRAALGEYEIQIAACARRFGERGGDPKIGEELVKAVRACRDDLTNRRTAITTYGLEFRACDPERTPVRPPSATAVKAYESSSRFRAVRI